MAKKYRSFMQQKLWRSKAAVLLEATGSKIECKTLTDQEFDLQLRRKLAEEADEVKTATNRMELITELADLSEVIDVLCTLHGLSKKEIAAAQEEKRKSRGTFTHDSFVTIAHHLEHSFGEQYCLNDPLKYPEVIEQSNKEHP